VEEAQSEISQSRGGEAAESGRDFRRERSAAPKHDRHRDCRDRTDKNDCG